MSFHVIYEDLGVKDYKETWDYQESVFQSIIDVKTGKSHDGETESPVSNRLIFVEHPHVYTLGKSGSENNLLLNYIQLQAAAASFYKTNRGGDITYHGPGQIVGYPIFNLENLKLGIREYIYKLEEAIILTLKEYDIQGERSDGATGVWLDTGIPAKSRKICAIGVRASRYVTMHGFALNVNTDLEYFNHINPCGYTDRGVTSIQNELGEKINFEEAKRITKQSIEKVFNINWVNEVT